MNSCRALPNGFSALLCVLVLLSACGGQSPVREGSTAPVTPEGTTPVPALDRPATAAPALPAGGIESPTPPPATPIDIQGGGQGTALPPAHPVFLEPVPTPGSGTARVPEELLKAIVQDLAARTGTDPASIDVVQAEAVVWSDGSLGCPRPGLMYTQALEEGYRVVLRAAGQEFDYHAAQSGHFFLCGGHPLRPSAVPGAEPGLSPDQ